MISTYDISVQYGSDSIPMSAILDEVSTEEQIELLFTYENVFYLIRNRVFKI